MKTQLTISLVLAMLLGSAGSASALVPCGAKDRLTGLVRDGSAIHLRTTCRSAEAQVPAADLGAHGAVWRDANGAFVGSAEYFSTGGNGGASLYLRGPGGEACLYGGLNVSGNLPPSSGSVSFTSNDCSGQELLNRSEQNPTNGFQIRGVGVTYCGPTTAPSITLHSSLHWPFANQAACDSTFGAGNATFVSPDACCSPQTFTDKYGPVIKIDLSGFVQPFHIDVQ
jgi:hypothetical protein